MRASAIIVAAGSGSRLGRAEPKAFVLIGGRPMLHYSLAAIARVSGIDEIIVTVPAGMEPAARACAIAANAAHLPIKITPGGAERQDSVRIALALVSAESDFVLVHDAARPLARPDLFAACLAAAERAGGAIAAIPAADTLKRVAEGAIVATLPRAGLWQAQTPQAFRRSILIAAHERAKSENIAATDDADLAERIGAAVEVVESVAPNLKITTQADLAMAEAILFAREDRD
ncbi:MAG: 2-C-methyl-D-erythritol 4-phosphate cytidylyltransferase [Candidatus Binataceae bacterium]